MWDLHLSIFPTYFQRYFRRFIVILAIGTLIVSIFLYYRYGLMTKIKSFTIITENMNSERLNIFHLLHDNITIDSSIRAAIYKSYINKMKIDSSTLKGEYRNNATYSRIEKIEIMSECINVYPFNEAEHLVVKQSNYTQALLRTPFGKTPIALHGAGDFHSSILKGGVNPERENELEILNFLNTDPQMAFLDFGAMLGSHELKPI